MSKILYEVYKNDIKDSESVMYGKYYARLKSIETMSMARMAKHISEHGSVFTEDVVEGVMKKFKTCLLEMLLESKKVKVAGLGTFYLTAECQKGGADKEEDFNVKEHLKALHIRFLPDQAAEDNISSREFIKKAEFVKATPVLTRAVALTRVVARRVTTRATPELAVTTTTTRTVVPTRTSRDFFGGQPPKIFFWTLLRVFPCFIQVMTSGHPGGRGG